MKRLTAQQLLKEVRSIKSSLVGVEDKTLKGIHKSLKEVYLDDCLKSLKTDYKGYGYQYLMSFDEGDLEGPEGYSVVAKGSISLSCLLKKLSKELRVSESDLKSYIYSDEFVSLYMEKYYHMIPEEDALGADMWHDYMIELEDDWISEQLFEIKYAISWPTVKKLNGLKYKVSGDTIQFEIKFDVDIELDFDGAEFSLPEPDFEDRYTGWDD